MPVSILLADESDILRGTIRRFLSYFESEIKLLGEAPTFFEAVQMAQKLRPQILLMDLLLYSFQMSAEELKTRLPHTLLLAMSFTVDDKAKILADSMGAIALVDKMAIVSDLVPSILRIASPELNAAD
jgi:pilus assembly protein CpaE